MSRKPAAMAASRLKWTAFSAPIALAYSAIFSLPTSYSKGG